MHMLLPPGRPPGRRRSVPRHKIVAVLLLLHVLSGALLPDRRATDRRGAASCYRGRSTANAIHDPSGHCVRALSAWCREEASLLLGAATWRGDLARVVSVKCSLKTSKCEWSRLSTHRQPCVHSAQYSRFKLNIHLVSCCRPLGLVAIVIRVYKTSYACTVHGRRA